MGKQRHAADLPAPLFGVPQERGVPESGTGRQVIGKLRETEVLQGKGLAMEEILRHLGGSDATYYTWRKEYRGLGIDRAKRVKELEQENIRLRKVVSDLTIDKSILKEAGRGNF